MRHELAGRLEQVTHTSRGRSFVEACLLDRSTDQQRPVFPRHEIAALTPGDTAQHRTIPRQVQQLTTHRPDRNARTHAFDFDLSAPASRREHDAVAGQRSAFRFDQQIAAATARDALHAAVLDQLSAMTTRCGRESACQFTCGHVPMDADQQSAGNVGGQVRLFSPSGVRIEHLRGDSFGLQMLRALEQTRHRLLVQRDFHRAVATIGDRSTAGCGDACDECVEEVEASDGELEQRSVVARFEIRREHAGRCLRRTHAGGPVVDDLNGGAAARQLVRHRAADDARADDDNVARGSHERILPRIL